ncbi:hydrogenase maturation protease [Glaciimonas sp. PCH181]|uniref:hydrogenase maturation protease n=1 Tax=Glaciimonas sp. PCH181 TaxID=2133943 RepID=UPI000D389423|nr:hydrogenase maturation protease [Glaciimonas sp. PCH181]PUA19137.1 Ni/Fe hydrogenase [Glaciimonas sp. PCH181]
MNAENDHIALDDITLAYFNHDSALIYGIGNIGRQDDGLGWEFIDSLETSSACPKAEKVKFYQLNLEDADLIKDKRRVLFVDASKDATVDTFRLYKAEQKMDFSFTSHAMSIETIMATCWQCFGKIPEVYVLAIRGYEWELEIGLTTRATSNLALAISHVARPVAKQLRQANDYAQCNIGA